MIIGLDLSVNSTGVCVRKGKDEVRYFLIVPKLTKRMKAINDMKSVDICYKTYDKINSNDSHNIKCISNEIRGIIEDMREKGEEVEKVVIEDVALAAKGRSIITLTLLNGYVRCMLDGLKVKYETVTPTQWKKELLGNGAADKELIVYHWARFDQKSCQRMMDMNCKCDDVADAYFLSCWGSVIKY